MRGAISASTLVALAALVLLTLSCSAQIVCFDGTFNLANYSQSTYITGTDPANVTVTVSQSQNGNPGTAVEITEAWSDPSITFATRVAMINNTCSFNPAVRGALEGLDFSVDSSLLGSGSVILGGTHNARTLLLQNGSFYQAIVVGPSLVQGVYQTIFGAGLSASSFQLIDLTTGALDPDSNPDFSPSGGPINFGLLFSFGHINLGAGGVDVLFDNLGYVGGNSAFLATPAAQQLAKLMVSINSFGLPGGMTTSLLAKVNAAFAALNAGNTTSACGNLTALINQTQAQSGKHLTVDQANSIIGAAVELQSQLGC